MIAKNESVKIYTDALIVLHKDVILALEKYFKNGKINIVSVIGLLENHKLGVIAFSKDPIFRTGFQSVENPPSYVG